MGLKVVSGKRKMAVAKATIKEGSGRIMINNKPYAHLDMFDRLRIDEPLRIAKEQLGEIKFDVEVRIAGGGRSGQIEAARLAIARALVAGVSSLDKAKGEMLKKSFLAYDRNLLVADTRLKETYKPGDSKARAKRQKSYR